VTPEIFRRLRWWNAVYTTANEGLVSDTASESGDVSDDESDRPAVDGCDQDVPPLDASELCQDETEPVTREPAAWDEWAW